MKNILRTVAIAIIALFTGIQANAQVITAERAGEIAKQFFANGKQKAAAYRSTNVALTQSADSRAITGDSDEAPTYHIFTGTNGKGFVIVSGEETENPIIGYSFDNTIDTNNLPDGFVDYMSDIDAQVRALREYNAANPQKAAAARSAMQKAADYEYNATSMGEIVVDLKTAPWGQHGPFNKLCPVINGVNAVTGCVPTAFAILCHYYKWPENGSGTYTNSGQTIDISTSTYDYASMRNDNYPSGQYTEAEANAVALLMRDLGFAYGVLYGTSSTDKSENASTLKSAFSYKSEYNPSGSGMDAMWRSSVGDETFIASLKECLDKERPIPFSSKSTDPETGIGSIRHIFILDGYTENNYFHFNYGWNGSGNGWYTIDFMQPDDDSDYSTEQRAYLDLIPNRTPRTVTVSANPAGAGTVTVNDNENSAEVTEGTYATLKATANNGYTFSHWSNGSTDNPLKVKVEAEGNDYVANFLTVGNTRVNVSVSYNSSYGTVAQKNGTTVSGTGLTPYQNSEVTLVATPLDGYVFNGWTVIKGTNSTNYSGTELTFIATENMSVEANFSLTETDYIIDNTTGTTLTSSRVGYWEHNSIELTLSTDEVGIAYNGYISLFAGATGSKTYTLTAPTGYTITKYKFSQCRSQSTSSTYNLSIVADTEYPLTTSDQDITISNVNAATAQFTIKGDAGRSMYTKQIIVTLRKDGTGGAITPVTYSINITKNPTDGGSVTINGAAVSQKSVTEGTLVTVVATPAAGYKFDGWEEGTTTLTTNTSYSFTAGSNKNLTANFSKTGYTVTVAAGEGGVAYIGTKGTTSTTVDYNTNLTITAEANDGYEFVEWRAYDSHFSSNAQQNVTVTTDVTYTAVFQAIGATPAEYPTPTGATYENNYLTSVTTTGAKENISYTASAHPGNALVTVPGTVRVEQGQSFTLNLVANSLSSSTSSVAEDMRYCHASLFTDFDGDRTFGAAAQTWGNKTPGNNIAGNYSSVMNITKEITVPADAPLGTSHVRMIYTNAWKDWPTNGTAVLDKGIVYDIVVEVVEPSNEKTLTVTFAGAAWSNESSGYYEQIVTNTTPAVTVRTADGSKSVGYSTISGVKHPYLLHNNNFIISIPAPYKIAGYSLTYKAHDFGSNKTFTYTTAQGDTQETITQNGVEKTLTVTGLNNSEIAIKVSDNSSKAGVIITALEITYVEATDVATYTVAVTADENGTATASAETVVEGNDVTLTATANSGYKFAGWYNGETKVSEANPYTFTVTSDINYEARFEELFPDGAYKIYWQADNRGYLAYHGTDYPNEAKLADVTYSGCQNLHYNSSTDDVSLVWYLITASDGKRYLFEVATGKFLGVNTSVYDNGQANKLSTTEAWSINVEPNTYSTRLGHYIITTVISGTKNLLCSGCGTEKTGHPVRWLAVNDNNQKDGGAPLQLVEVNNVTVADDVMAAVRAVIEPRTFHFKAEIDGWRDNNPNTHLGTITVGGTPMKLTPAHLTASELTMPLNAGSALAFTRKYRGFNFNGFYIGEAELGTNPTLTADNIAAISEATPLIAKFTATDDVTLFYDDDEFSYRIPAIVKTGTNRLVAISDYRHSHDDIGRDNHGTGTLQVDLVMRTSEDNGLTWTDKVTIAEGNQNFGYGDAAAVANGDNILVMAVAGNVFYAYASSSSKQRTYRIYSTDNGDSWTKEEISSNLYTLFPNGYGMFFGSGKLVVDPDFNGSGNARVYGAVLLKDSNGERNYVLYSDDWGATWNILGGISPASQNEPKVEILPNGQILLSSRRSGGRTFNVFTYSNKATSEGTWDTAANGCNNGGNSTNGEIICLDAKRTNGQPTKILLQSQPSASARSNVSIWYKELTGDNFTASDIASGWTKGLQVSDQLSAYSAMCLQENGEVALFFEEAPCHNDDATYGYSMVYVPLTIEEATANAFLNPNADVEYIPTEFNIELTDAEGNTYSETLDYIPDDVAAVLTTKYPFITLGENGVKTDNGYTNTVTLPFKVSNANTTVWHNIYWPSYNTANNTGCPVYLSASSVNDTYVPKVTEDNLYGNSSYNTLNYGDKIAWAIYSVNNSFEFVFKNKFTGNYIQAENVATGNAQNVKYVAETNATAFTLLKDTGSRVGDYALVAKVGETTGYLCSTSAAGYHYATHYNGNNHEGAWVVFKEAPDYQAIVDALTANVAKFAAGDGNYTDNKDIDAIKATIEDIGTTPLNTLNTHTTTVQTVKDSYTEITLTVPAVNDVVPGSVEILNEAVSHKFVPKGNVTIEAFPAAGYRFVNWTRPAAAASAAARTAEARNSNVVSEQNPYTVTVSEALSLEANFEQIVVNATLTDAQSNEYEVQVSGFTTEVTKDAVADKLREAYPYITLGTTDQEGNVIDFGVLNIDGTAYTYTNRVELPFKVSNTTYIWHNIYWQNNDWPVYLSASTADDIYVPKVTGSYAYGDHPTYNTKSGNNNISWAIYNVNNGFEFIFKNKVTQKYIRIRNVADEDAQNVQYVENAEDATAFTIEMKPEGQTYDTDAKYALAAMFGEEKGYLCSTSAGYDWVTHYYNETNNGYGHQGAWIEFKEAPDYYSKIMDLGIMLGYKFGAGDGKYIITDAISEINDRIANNSENITLNTIKQDSIVLNDAINNWPAVGLTINPVEGGTTNINGEENVVHKYVPNGYKLPLAAVPAEGYQFVSWTDGTNEIVTAEYTKTISGGKGDVIELTANFAKNIYTISVTAGEGGSATASAETVEHGSEVTLTATPSAGYSFANWTKGTDVVSTNATYTFPVTDDGEYVANFELSNTPVKYYTVRIETEGLSNDKFAAYINTGTTQNETAKDYEPGSTVRLIAIQDNSDVGSYDYAFEGWYLNGTLVSINEEIEFNITSNITYTAKFVEGIRISTRAERGWPHIYLYESDKEVGGTSMSTILVPGRRLKLSVTPEYGCRFTHWTVGDEVVSTDNPFTTEPLNEAVTFKAICEPAYYYLTVRSNPDTAGKVTVNSNESSSEMTVKVGHNTEATITATPNDGFKFVNWTKGTDVVSTKATYTIAAIDAIENLEDVEYIANFIEAEEAEPGIYYRFAYEFPAAAAASAARTGATRAAGDVTYTLTPKDGGMTSGSKTSEWISSEINSLAIRMVSTTANGDAIEGIQRYSDAVFKLMTSVTSPITTIKYTLSAPDGYIISNYSFQYNQRSANNITFRYDGNEINITNTTVYDLSVEPNKQTAEFTLTSSTFNQNAYLLVKNFTVTIQEVGSGEGEGEGGEGGGGETPETPETPETVKYYIQSEACGVTNKTNALLMEQDGESASSIFYYDNNKLLSYKEGRYLDESNSARGLQAVGAAGGDVEIIDNKIKVSSGTTVVYLHANKNVGTSTTYFVDRCTSRDGSDNGDEEHNFIVEEVTTLPVTISSALHATFYAPVAVSIPEGVKAYVLKEKDITAGSYVTMTLLTNGIIPANTGVILKSEEATTYYFNITENTDEARAEVIGNILEGTVAKSYVNKDAYILTKKNNVVGMYPLSNNSYITGGATATFTNNSHKAYLPVEGNFAELLKSSNGFRFVFDDGNTTGVEDIERELEDTIYDLQGRKLNEITEPGIYIVGGKKVWIK